MGRSGPMASCTAYINGIYLFIFAHLLDTTNIYYPKLFKRSNGLLKADVAFEMRILFVLIGIAIVVFISLCAKFRLMDRIYGQIQKIKARHKKSST